MDVSERPTLSARLGRRELVIYRHLTCSYTCTLPIAGGDELHPRPSCSPGTSGRWMELQMVHLTMGKEEADSRVYIEKV